MSCQGVSLIAREKGDSALLFVPTSPSLLPACFILGRWGVEAGKGDTMGGQWERVINIAGKVGRGEGKRGSNREERATSRETMKRQQQPRRRGG